MKTGWIQTDSGIRFWPLEPRVQDVNIPDIAHALSMKCRYNGHCKKFYSVAEHSLWVSELVSEKNALWGLLHDASEAYLPDVPAPIKPDLPGFKAIEKRVQDTIMTALEMPLEEPPEVKSMDRAILGDEHRQVMRHNHYEWMVDGKATGKVEIQFLMPEEACYLFVERWVELTSKMRGK